MMAPHLSALTISSAPEVPELPNYGFRLAVQQQVGPTRYKDPNLVVAISTFIARLDAAVREYNHGREQLVRYIMKLPEHDALRSHGLAAAHFMSCILHAHPMVLAGFAAARLLNMKEPDIEAALREPDYDALRQLNNRIKHFDEDVRHAARDGTTAPSAPIWITNSGLAAMKTALPFEQLASILTTHSRDAEGFVGEWMSAS